MCPGIDSPLTAIGFSDAHCTDAASGGGCTCTGTVDHMGSIGWMTLDPQKSGNYTVSGSLLTADQIANYGYCVAGDKLTLIPQSAGFTSTGTIVLQKSSTSGSAGDERQQGSAGTNGTAGTSGRRAPAAWVARRTAGAAERPGRRERAAPPDAVARWDRRNDRHGRTRRDHRHGRHDRARGSGGAGPTATGPATSTRPRARRAGPRTARFARSARRTRARFTRSGTGARP